MGSLPHQGELGDTLTLAFGWVIFLGSEDKGFLLQKSGQKIRNQNQNQKRTISRTSRQVVRHLQVSIGKSEGRSKLASLRCTFLDLSVHIWKRLKI